MQTKEKYFKKIKDVFSMQTSISLGQTDIAEID